MEKGLKILEKQPRGVGYDAEGARQRKHQTKNLEKLNNNNKTLTTVKNAARRTCLENNNNNNISERQRRKQEHEKQRDKVMENERRS